MKQILFITNYPSPYRVHFYDELGKYADITVLFADRVEEKVTRDAAWFQESLGGFKRVQLKKRVFTFQGRDLCVDVIPWIRKPYDAIVVCGYSSPTAVLAMAYMRMAGIPFYMEVDGGLIRQDSRIKYLVKKSLVSLPTAWLCSGKEAEKYLVHYGAKASQIFHFPFSSLWQKDILESVPAEEEKRLLRQKLKISEDKVIVSVSRFIPSKRLDMLIRCCPEVGNSVGIYLIGGKATDEYQKLKNELNADNIHFVGFLTKEELAEYYRAADLFALPTQSDVWGLVVNEAMACGLPVITTDQCVAGLELVRDGVNGYLVPVDDQQALIRSINTLLAEDYRQMGQAALETIRPYTIENMVKAHVEIFS